MFAFSVEIEPLLLRRNRGFAVLARHAAPDLGLLNRLRLPTRWTCALQTLDGRSSGDISNEWHDPP